MELTYENFEGLNIEEEIYKIKRTDVVNVRVSTTDKAQLFLLGMLFAANKKIKIINKKELDFENKVKEDLESLPGKSFIVMTYVWEKLFDGNFTNKNYSLINTEFDKLLENVKRLNLSQIDSNPIEKKFFLICPVRGASDEKKAFMKEYEQFYEDNGYIVHNPNGDTVQEDKFGGYAICRQNALGIATSSEIRMFYDKGSKGSMFDLGVAYYLEKPLTVIQEYNIVYDETDFGDYIVKNWNNRDRSKQLKL